MSGINLGGWFSQIDAIEEKNPQNFPGIDAHIDSFLSVEDFARIKKWGFSHVRLPVDWYNLFDAQVNPIAGRLSRLDSAVANLLSAGLEVILDLHRCPGHNFESAVREAQSFFTDPTLRRDCLKVWAVLAERYGSLPKVALELLNEPVAPNNDIWNEVKDELAREIRRLAPKATLVIGSNLWNQAPQFAGLTPVDDDNVQYSFHLYSPLVFTHQNAPWMFGDAYYQSRVYPGSYDLTGEPDGIKIDHGNWNKSRLHDLIAPVFKFRETYQVKVACDEFGVYMGGPDRVSQMAWIQDCLELFRENQIGWTYWNYKNLDFGLVSKGEQLFNKHPPYDNSERTDFGLLGILQKFS